MANMSYCRFQNTLSDLRDCLEALEDGDQLSGDELGAARQLIEVAKCIVAGEDDFNLVDEEGESDDE